ncbi:substrate-binding periplasmic protein [Thalassotalea piscium]
MRLQRKITVLAFLLCSSFSVFASERVVQIGTIGFVPYGINDQGRLSGLYYDLANMIVANAGYTSNNMIRPYARIVKELKLGTLDLTIMFRNSDLDEFVDYIAPLQPQKVVAMSLKGNRFNHIKELSGKTIIYIRGAKFTELFEQVDTVNKYQVIDYLHGIKMLIAGRADVIIGSLHPIKRAANALEQKDNIIIYFDEPLLLALRTPWVQVSKKSHSYIAGEKLKKSFLQLQTNNSLDALRVKYEVPIVIADSFQFDN